MDAIQKAALETLAKAMEVHRQRFHQTRPFITLSFGMSLDGKIATRTGDSKYISSSATREFVHELRHLHQGILVGIRTVQLDHPSLTTRLASGHGRDAQRIILDSQLAIDLNEPILSLTSEAKTWIVTKTNSDRKKINFLISRGLEVLEDSTISPHIDLPWLMQALITKGITSLMVEGGGKIHESFIRHQFFDRIYAQVSPILIGGADAKTPVEGLGFATLKEASRVAFSNHFKTDRDIILVAERNPEETI